MATLKAVLKRFVPWWARIGAKGAVASLPLGYTFWRSLSLFRFGAMDRPEWAFRTFERHYDAAGRPGEGRGFTTLELGCGDSLFTALLARARGGDRTFLVDVGRFARLDLAPYRGLLAYLAERGLPLDGLDRLDSVDALLEACHARYDTDGLAALRRLPDASVDFAFSNAVLQHVRRAEFGATLRELRRVLRPGGVTSHSIGVWDHFSDALNHLRFSERAWESGWISSWGLYTNRLRRVEMLEEFRRAGFDVEEVEVNRWATLPTPRRALAPEFRAFDDDELRVRSFNVVLRPRAEDRPEAHAEPTEATAHPAIA